MKKFVDNKKIPLSAILLLFIILVVVSTFYPKNSCKDIDMVLYRKHEVYGYFLLIDKNADVYYRTTELEDLNQFQEGDNIRVCAETLSNVDPPEKYLYGIKDSHILISKELKGINQVRIL